MPGLKFIEFQLGERHNYQYVIIEVEEENFGLTRDELLRVMHAENVLVRRYFYPGSHRQMPYRAYYPNAGLLLPETERLCQRVLSFPTGTGIAAADVARIGEILRRAHQCAPEVRRALAATAA